MEGGGLILANKNLLYIGILERKFNSLNVFLKLYVDYSTVMYDLCG